MSGLLCVPCSAEMILGARESADPVAYILDGRSVCRVHAQAMLRVIAHMTRTVIPDDQHPDDPGQG